MEGVLAQDAEGSIKIWGWVQEGVVKFGGGEITQSAGDSSKIWEGVLNLLLVQGAGGSIKICGLSAECSSKVEGQ